MCALQVKYDDETFRILVCLSRYDYGLYCHVLQQPKPTVQSPFYEIRCNEHLISPKLPSYKLKPNFDFHENYNRTLPNSICM
jgi:hypothetical protein